MTSPYLEPPFVPLGVALPQMLKNIEAEFANEKLEPAQKSCLRRRAELILGYWHHGSCGKRRLTKACYWEACPMTSVPNA
jgi:hypothetical protein